MFRLFTAILVVFMYGCANIIPPTGGPRDAEAPKLLRAFPAQGTVYFKSNVIRLEFDEYIRLQNAGNVRVTPALPEKPIFSEKFNVLTMDLGNMVLEPNTTYTINFGDALTDLNENNKFENLRYVFSTGAFLDSLLVKGKVVDAEKRLPVEKITVALYPIEDLQNSDSVVWTKKPFYFLKTDKTGIFALENLKAGKYVLFAFDDQDNNLLYKINEAAGFIDTVLVVDTANHMEAVEMVLFENKNTLLKLVERRSIEPGLVRVRFSSSVDSLHVGFLPTGESKLHWQLMGDSAYVFHQSLDVDSLQFLFSYDGKRDTLQLTNRKKGESTLKTPTISLKAGNQPSVLEQLTLHLSRPITKVDTALISWKEDTLAVRGLGVEWSVQGNELTAKANLKENKRYEVFFDKGALTDWFGVACDTFRFTFNSQSLEAFGDLVFEGTDSIPADYSHLQLLDEQYKVLYTLKLKRGEKLVLRKLKPISYKLRLLADTNGNEKWDGGDYNSRKQPEKLWYYPDALKLRANWEVEVNLSGAGRK